jgi:tRNA G18 (ribose-2'-O)-methylase SpoU
LKEANLNAKCAFVIGSEGRGVSAALEDAATGLRIPTSGVESLNAAVAAGIVLYEAWRQRTS